MKKKLVRFVSLALALVTVLSLTLMLASCNLSGTYKAEGLLLSNSEMTFKGNKVTINGSFWVLSSTKELTYKIDDDKIIFTDDEGNAKSCSFEKGDGYIVIDGLKYTKQ